jgi:hypothetical protein
MMQLSLDTFKEATMCSAAMVFFMSFSHSSFASEAMSCINSIQDLGTGVEIERTRQTNTTINENVSCISCADDVIGHHLVDELGNGS